MGMIFKGEIIGAGFAGGPVANPILLPNGSVDSPSLAPSNEPNTGIYFGTTVLGFSINGVSQGYFDTSRLNLNRSSLGLGGQAYIYTDAPNNIAIRNGNYDQTQRWYGSNGAYFQISTQSELLTIAAAASTDTTMTIPANGIVLGVAVRVTVAIPTAATFTVTGATSGTTFNTAAISTAINSTDLGDQNCPYKNGAAQAIRITPNLTPADNTGRVRIVLMYMIPSAPTS